MKGEVDKNDITATAQDRSKATVRLYRAEGNRQGDELFVINERNLVVSRIEVKTRFKKLIVRPHARGIRGTSGSAPGSRVVQRVEDPYSQYAYIYRIQGRLLQGNGR